MFLLPFLNKSKFLAPPGNSEDKWQRKVIEPCVEIVSKFMLEEDSSSHTQQEFCDLKRQNVPSRDLWSQFVCEVSFSAK